MKFINHINVFLFCIGISLITTSCELTKIPEDTMSPSTYFKNGSQLELWTNGFYAQMDNAETVVATNADDNVDNTLGDILNGQRSAADESGWTWTRLRDINYFLQNSPNCEDISARTQYEGVAYFHRAYFYFVKVRRYGDVPWYDQVIKTTDYEFLYQPRDDREVVMQHIMEDIDRAIEMLPTKKDLYHVTKWTALALKSRIALYEGTFRKYHGIAGYEKYLTAAADAGETFINESGYKLYSMGETPYRDLFNSPTAIDEEIILARAYSSTANVMHGVQFNIANERQGFTKRFMNHYLMADGSFYSAQANYDTKLFADEVDNRDPRLAQTVMCPGYVQKGGTTITTNNLNALTGYQPIKFVGEAAYDGANKSFIDFPLFRAAEVYLNFAEAKAELGNLTQADLDKSINVIRTRAKMPAMDLTDANGNMDPLLIEYYPNVTSNNKGVILEIRRERTIELCLEGFRIWDIFRWKEGKQLTKAFLGCYFPGEGEYDMDADGEADLVLYTGDKPSFSGTAKKIGSDVILTNTTSGNIHACSTSNVTWDEDRDYLWPIPASERVLSGGVLTQNPGWTDSTNF
ncbi:MAG: RagB/SusD family nutrient uptake outer membrane protein [Muribaculaceae bacterium]|nr:RagB/SusD family nutrient uptake outer membrane protein [Muribaculaceae bacterium]